MFGRINRLRRYNNRVKNIVWGIRIPKEIKNRWLLLSIITRLPVNRLVAYALQDWLTKYSRILTDESSRNRLAEHITQLYLQNKLWKP